MNCLCNFFEDNCLWILIIVLIILFSNNNCGCGYNNRYNNDSSCGC